MMLYQEPFYKTAESSTKVKPPKPQIEIENPLIKDIFVNSMELTFDSHFSVKGVVEIRIDNQVLLKAGNAGDYLKSKSLQVPLQEQALPRGKSIQIFIWNPVNDDIVKVSANISISEDPNFAGIASIPSDSDVINRTVSLPEPLFAQRDYFEETVIQLVDMEGFKKMILLMSAQNVALPSYLLNQGGKLVSHHRFRDNVLDNFSNNDGTVTGTASYLSSSLGKSFDFDGSTYISIANEPNYDREINQPFSISYWIKSSNTGVQMMHTTKAVGFTPNNGYHVRNFTDNKAYFNMVSGGNPAKQIGSSSVVIDGTWHHIVVTFAGNSNANGMKMYVDGVLEATGVSSVMTGSALNNDALTIGGFVGAGVGDLIGEIDDHWFFNRELTSAEVSILYNIGEMYLDDVTSTWSSRNIQNMVDGDISTLTDANEIGATITTARHYVEFPTLQTIRLTCKIQLSVNPAVTLEARLYYSSDGISWTLLDTVVEDTNSSLTDYTLGGTEVTAKYAKLEVERTVGASSGLYKIYEIYDANVLGGSGNLSFEVLDDLSNQWIELISSVSIGAIAKGQAITKTIGDVINDSSNDKFNYGLPSTQTNFRAKLVVLGGINTSISIIKVA